MTHYISYLSNHSVFLLHCYCNDLLNKDFKTLKNTGFGALAGQIQHMAAQKVRFTPRLLRQVALAGTFQAQLHWNP
jgi:hypothetical protein